MKRPNLLPAVPETEAEFAARQTQAFRDHVLKALSEIQKVQTFNQAVMQVLFERVSETTHVSVTEAQQITGLSRWSLMRNFTLETIPGTRRHGFRLEELSEKWLPARTARAIVARHRGEEERKAS